MEILGRHKAGRLHPKTRLNIRLKVAPVCCQYMRLAATPKKSYNNLTPTPQPKKETHTLLMCYNAHRKSEANPKGAFQSKGVCLHVRYYGAVCR